MAPPEWHLLEGGGADCGVVIPYAINLLSLVNVQRFLSRPRGLIWACVSVLCGGLSHAADSAIPVVRWAPTTANQVERTIEVTLGGVLQLEADVQGADATARIRWYRDGVVVSGPSVLTSSRAALVVPEMSPDKSGSYWAEVENPSGLAPTSRAIVMVRPAEVPVIFGAPPASLVMGPFTQLTFSVGGSFPMTFAWLDNGVPIPDFTGPTFAPPLSGKGPYTLRVTNAAGSVTSAPIRIVPAAAPVPPRFRVHPGAVTAAIGETWETDIRYDVDEGGDTSGIRYKVFLKGVEVTYPVLAGRRVAADQAGDVRVEATNAAGTTVSETARVLVSPARPPSPPRFTLHPASQTVTTGSSALINLQVELQDPAGVTLQWRRNGQPLDGATGTTLTFLSTTDRSGTYDVVATHASGTTTSDPAVVEFLPRDGYLDAFAAHPATVAGGLGSFVAFRFQLQSVYQPAGSPGLPGFTVSWSKNDVPLPDQTGTVLYPNLATAADLAAAYRAVLTFADGRQVKSRPGYVRDVASGLPAEIREHPSAVTPLLSARMELKVVARGEQPLSYQWFKDGVALPGETRSLLERSEVATADAGRYTVRVGNRFSEIESEAARVVVAPLSTPRIHRQPEAQIALPTGLELVTLAVQAGSGEKLVYQWFKDGVRLAGEEAPVLEFRTFAPERVGKYRVTVTNVSGLSVTSDESLVTVAPGDETPGFVVNPTGRSVQEGEALTLVSLTRGLSRRESGSSPVPRYQWYRDGQAIPGATAASYRVDRVVAGDTGTYQVEAEDGVRRVTSAAASVVVVARTVAPRPPIVVSSPVAASVFVPGGQRLRFEVKVLPEPNLTFDWFRDGHPIPTVSGSTLEIASARVADAGVYTLFVRNASGTVRAFSQTVQVSPPSIPPRLLVPPPERAESVLYQGLVVIPDVEASVPSTSFRWLRDGVPVQGQRADDPRLTLLADPALAGSYVLEATNTYGTTRSAPMVVTLSMDAVAGAFAGTPNLQFGQPGFPTVTDQGVLVWRRPEGTTTLLSLAGDLTTATMTTGWYENIGFDATGTGRVRLSPAGVNPEVWGTLVLRGTAIEATGVYSVRPLTLQAVVPGGWEDVAGVFSADAGGLQFRAILASGGTVGLLVRSEAGAAGIFAQLVENESKRRLTAANSPFESLEVRYDRGTDRLVGTVTRRGQVAQAFTLPRIEGPYAGRLVNVATRGFTGNGELGLSAGIVVAGQGSRTLLLRGVGPTLGGFGVGQAISESRLEWYAGTALVASNSQWDATEGPQISLAGARSGAFPLTAGSRDGALLRTVLTGSYSARVVHPRGVNGVALIEAYDATEETALASIRVANLSSRGWVDAGENVLIAGLSVGGQQARRLLIRAAGPALAPFGVTHALADPVLRVYRNGVLVASNDTWSDAPTGTNQPTLQAVMQSVGAFPFATGSKDAALSVLLPPGGYTVQVSGRAGTNGIALVELYEVP